MADLRIVDAPVLLQESITDDVKMPTGGLGNFSIRLGDILWYVITKEQLANKNYVDLSSKGVKDSLDEHIADKANPHQVTKTQVGLGNVDNTADINKPLSDVAINALSGKSDKTDTYTKNETDNRIAALSNTTYAGHKGYATLALAQATQASLTANTIVEVTNDTPANNGVYLWDGTTLVKSTNDVLGQAKAYTDAEIVEVINTTIRLKKSSDPNIICLVADADGNALVWIDRSTGYFNAVKLHDNVYQQINDLKLYDDDKVIAGAVDRDGNVLWGVDKTTGNFFGAGLEQLISASQQSKTYQYYAQKQTLADINHVLSYGQSLSVGATATTILSTSQPYSNLTFNTSPRKDTEPTSVIPLFEQFNNPSADRYPNRGETHCSGLANYASKAMSLENSINPSSHVIFASTAGHGGYTIAQLSKGSAWYNILLDHVNDAKILNSDKTYKVQCIPWIQGENNAVSRGLQTPYADYRAALVQLQIDAETDIKAITGQTDKIRFITYQMSYAAATWSDIALAQLDLAMTNDNFMLSTPMYHLPYATDNVHLTNVGYKWLGAYIGRAYKQYVIDGRKPDFIKPLNAFIKDNKITIKFDVPTLPLVLDTTTLAVTTNHGFKVVDANNADVAINNITVNNDTVILTLTSTPTTDLTVRYALDYLGAGLTITGGASGNLRDSTTDAITIANTNKPLYHIAPHFKLTAYLDRGI